MLRLAVGVILNLLITAYPFLSIILLRVTPTANRNSYRVAGGAYHPSMGYLHNAIGCVPYTEYHVHITIDHVPYTVYHSHIPNGHVPFTALHSHIPISHVPFTAHHLHIPIGHVSYTAHHSHIPIGHVPYTVHHVHNAIGHVPYTPHNLKRVRGLPFVVASLTDAGVQSTLASAKPNLAGHSRGCTRYCISLIAGGTHPQN